MQSNTELEENLRKEYFELFEKINKLTEFLGTEECLDGCKTQDLLEAQLEKMLEYGRVLRFRITEVTNSDSDLDYSYLV